MEEERKPLSEEDKLIRKLRKKLRQIENLELSDRELNENELYKVNSKGSIRGELQRLLREQHSEELDIMKRQRCSVQEPDAGGKKSRIAVNVKTELSDDCQESSFEDSFTSNDQTTLDAGEDISSQNKISNLLEPRVKVERTAMANQCDDRKIESSKFQVSSTEARDCIHGQSSGEKFATCLWNDSTYHVYTLEGHNDIVLSVDCKDEIVLSASRDTMVKVWSVGSKNEERSLRGHTAAVTAVVFLPEIVATSVLRKFEGDVDAIFPVYKHYDADCRVLAISGSLDCTIRVWDVMSGEGFGSIYTYNGITVMGCGSWGAVTGTEGGKLEIWCIATGQRLAFVNAFQHQVTALYIDGNQICAGNCEGNFGIWHFDSNSRSLNVTFIMEPESQAYVSLRQLSAMASENGRFYFGDSGPNIKILDWKSGIVSRVANHLGDIGMTDSMALSSDGYLLSSSYFLDTGRSSVNIRESATGKYICSIIDNDEGRYLSMCTSAGNIVTGGHLLKVWVQVKKGTSIQKSKNKDFVIITPKFLKKLNGKAVESASEDDADWGSSTDDDNDADNSHASDSASKSAYGWWCSIL
ncbi:hypothetical protein SK128_021379 [Halocaridina rubra]|uniref:Uncharacterized protein n=1 Tax=Halocaridina rubra TaxID=373956 RepID=A0AAN8XLU4_HALRR